MACPKCGEKIVLRVRSKGKQQPYMCPKCGHKWKTKNQVILVNRFDKNDQSEVKSFGLPW